MKVVHLCLAGIGLADGWSYQENLLTKYHRKLGHEVTIITSEWIRDKSDGLEKTTKHNYINEYDCKVRRLSIKNGHTQKYKFKKYKNFYNTLTEETPDILFIHNVQFFDILKVVHYLKNHPNVKVYVDNHTDFSNSSRNWLSKSLLHKVIWKYCAQSIEPYVERFYGVLPARVDFLVDVYKIPKKKVHLLEMGMDDEWVPLAKNTYTNGNIREKYKIKPTDFLIVTGGKIDFAKRQTLLLMKAINKISRDDLKLIVFGSVSKELKEELEALCDNNKVHYIGWIDVQSAYKFFSSADLVVFPGRHSVFWEQVAGLGIPMLIKHWKGTTHIDVGGNCRFLYEDTVEEIQTEIELIINNPSMYLEMKNIAEKKGMNTFSYLKIAKKSLEIE